MRIEQIPNVLTIGRILAVPLVVALFYWTSNPWADPLAAFVFIFAAITDWIDGYLARKLQVTTPLGAFLDPVADKLMVATALVLLVFTFLVLTGHRVGSVYELISVAAAPLAAVFVAPLIGIACASASARRGSLSHMLIKSLPSHRRLSKSSKRRSSPNVRGCWSIRSASRAERCSTELPQSNCGIQSGNVVYRECSWLLPAE